MVSRCRPDRSWLLLLLPGRALVDRPEIAHRQCDDLEYRCLADYTKEKAARVVVRR